MSRQTELAVRFTTWQRAEKEEANARLAYLKSPTRRNEHILKHAVKAARKAQRRYQRYRDKLAKKPRKK